MKQQLSILLLVSILWQSLSNLTLMGGFLLNQEVITTAFCVNKDLPEMHCNGKCFLAEKIKLMNQDQEKCPEPVLVERVLPIISPPAQHLLLLTDREHEQWIEWQELNWYEAPVASIFHPPSII